MGKITQDKIIQDKLPKGELPRILSLWVMLIRTRLPIIGIPNDIKDMVFVKVFVTIVCQRWACPAHKRQILTNSKKKVTKLTNP